MRRQNTHRGASIACEELTYATEHFENLQAVDSAHINRERLSLFTSELFTEGQIKRYGRKHENIGRHLLNDGAVFCLGDKVLSLSNPYYPSLPGEKESLLNYAKKLCPLYSGFDKKGFNILAISNLDFDPAIMVMSMDDKNNCCLLLDDYDGKEAPSNFSELDRDRNCRQIEITNQDCWGSWRVRPQSPP